jgi:hypothetical protein
VKRPTAVYAGVLKVNVLAMSDKRMFNPIATFSADRFKIRGSIESIRPEAKKK